MKDLTCADMLHIHAVHQPAAGVYVVEAAFLGLSTINLWCQLTRITFCLSVLYQVAPLESISHFSGVPLWWASTPSEIHVHAGLMYD